MMANNNWASFVTNSNLDKSREQYGQSQKVPYCGSIIITLKKSLRKEGNRLVITRSEEECQHKSSLRELPYADRTMHIHIVVMSPKICTNDQSTQSRGQPHLFIYIHRILTFSSWPIDRKKNPENETKYIVYY